LVPVRDRALVVRLHRGDRRVLDEEVVMAKYVVLVNWTEKGVADAKATTDRAKRVEEMGKGMGITTETLYWTLGRYDIIGIFDAPDDETFALFGLKISALGSVRTETLRAFTRDEIGGIIGKL
jgi:uncharacterized protein with GYD domain